jgi:hypothetical protein
MKINLDSNSIGDYKIGEKGSSFAFGHTFFRQRKGLKFRTHGSFMKDFN